MWVKFKFIFRGGVFFIPFLIFFFIIAIPLFNLEAIMGQIFKKGPVEVFTMIHKKFTGIGWACIIVSWIISIYYAIILCWSVYYFFLSFISPLPWSMEAQKEKQALIYQNSNNTNNTNTTDNEINFMNLAFFKEEVLKVSGGIDNMGSINPNLMVCLIITYILIYLCISKGIKSSSKVVYFTAPAPIFLLIILLLK